MGQDFADYSVEQLDEVDTIVLGRRTYEELVAYWTSDLGTDFDPRIAQRMNSVGKLVLVAAYCAGTWTDEARRGQEINAVLTQVAELRSLGGQTVVVQCGRRPRPQGYTDREFRAVALALTEIARRCTDLDLRVGIHPHTGTGIETREDIERILAITELPVGFAPDSGQIAKGGSDVIDAFSSHLSRITHVHLKDWNGISGDGEGRDRSGYLNYTPIGDGVLPVDELLVMLDEAQFGGWINVELDATARAPLRPREAAARSKAHLQRRLSKRIAWRA